MGFEYRLRFSCEDESAVLMDLARLRGATQTGPTALEFRSADNAAGKMPDATLELIRTAPTSATSVVPAPSSWGAS